MNNILTWLQSNPHKWIATGVVLLLFAGVALAWHWLRERMNGWLTLIIVAIVLLLGALLIHPVRAHDHNRAELNSWYGTLASGKGPCCGGPSVDAKTLDGPDWDRDGDHYRVRIDGA